MHAADTASAGNGDALAAQCRLFIWGDPANIAGKRLLVAE
jgi:hypothetical protein